MKKVKCLLLPLLFFTLVSCNVNVGSGSNNRSVEVSSYCSQEMTLKNTWEIGYHHNVNGESYYYSWYINTDNGDLVIYDNDAHKEFLSIDYNDYKIIYKNYNGYNKGYLYYYGEYYVLILGE